MKLMKMFIVILISIVLFVCLQMVNSFAMRHEHEELHEDHSAIAEMQMRTYQKACENGNKLDMLLNIATNNVNPDINVGYNKENK